MAKARRYFLLGLVVVLSLSVGLVWYLALFLPARELLMKVYDVGQGDSIFIRTPGGYKILVDGGPDNKVLGYLEHDLGLFDRKIDVVVLTHPQEDHMFGLVEVIKRFQIGRLLVSGVDSPTNIYKLWFKTLQERSLTPTVVTAGTEIGFPDNVKMKIIWPKEEHPVVKDLNEAMVVFQLSYGNFDALLTGDGDQQTQPYTGSLGHIEVLKVPHHGSKTALSDSFLKQITPEISVISVGKNNRYGHPGQNALEQLRAINSKIYRTDQNGTVEIVSDGNKWYTVTEK